MNGNLNKRSLDKCCSKLYNDQRVCQVVVAPISKPAMRQCQSGVRPERLPRINQGSVNADMTEHHTRPRFSLFLPQGWRKDLIEISDPIEKYEAMTQVAREADRSGYDAVWVYDHFHTVPTAELEATFEAWTVTAGLARDTERIKIGQMVTCNGYRNPALLAKMASTLDVMSHGRLYFGLGAGWLESEWRAYGYAFPELKTRMGMLREACEIIHRMWTENYPVYQGKHYMIDRPINEPKGVQKPHPTFWIGGSGEQVTLRLVAKYGNGCNISTGSLDKLLEKLPEKLGVLRRHCDEIGRNYDEIVRSTTINVHLIRRDDDAERATAQSRGGQSYMEYARSTIVGTPEQIVERLHTLVDAGVNYFVIYMPRVAYDVDQVQWFSREVMHHFQS